MYFKLLYAANLGALREDKIPDLQSKRSTIKKGRPDPNPSSENSSITRRVKEAGEFKGINVLDHIIIGDGEYLSFLERGLL